MHGCACGTEIHSLATQFKVIPLFLTMKYDSMRGARYRILDKRPGEFLAGGVPAVKDSGKGMRAFASQLQLALGVPVEIRPALD